MKVLVTGAGALLGQGIIRTLQASALDVHIVAVDPNPLSAGLYWADEARIVPMANNPTYLERISDIAQETRPDAILIGTDAELGLFADHRAELETALKTRIVVSSPEVVRIADDKHETTRFLREHGFSYPRSALPENTKETDALVEGLGFPLIVKPRIGARSVGVHLVEDRAALENAISNVDGPVIQEYLTNSGHEYTAGALCFAGEVAATIVMRRDLRDGNTYRAYVDAFDDLNLQTRILATALKPVGPANFQFRLVDGRAVVFEINARFSGTTPFRMQAGFNEVEYTLRRMLLGERPAIPEIRPMTILRHWAETVVDTDSLIAEDLG